jgi:hypothetical protein
MNLLRDNDDARQTQMIEMALRILIKLNWSCGMMSREVLWEVLWKPTKNAKDRREHFKWKERSVEIFAAGKRESAIRRHAVNVGSHHIFRVKPALQSKETATVSLSRKQSTFRRMIST